jgi:hypothetical protein
MEPNNSIFGRSFIPFTVSPSILQLFYWDSASDFISKNSDNYLTRAAAGIAELNLIISNAFRNEKFLNQSILNFVC